MRRPIQHEVDSLARKILESSLPPNLVLRELHDDYGLDYEIEVFQGGQSTGAIFKLQLKGTQDPKYNANKDGISFSFDLKNAEYIIDQIKIPTVLVVCDVISKNAFWTVFQANQELLLEYQTAVDRGQKTFTINIPTKNSLPTTLEGMLADLAKAGDFLALNQISKIEPPIYSEHVHRLPDIEPEILHLSEKLDIARSEKLFSLTREHKTAEAEALINDILSSSLASPALQVVAAINGEKIALQKDLEHLGVNTQIQAGLELVARLEKIVERDKRLESLRDIHVVALNLLSLADQDYSLFTNWKMHEQTLKETGQFAEPLWGLTLPFVRQSVTNSIMGEISKIPRILGAMDQAGLAEVLPRAFIKVLFPITIFYSRLRLEDLDPSAEKVQNWIQGSVNFVRQAIDQATDQRDKNYALSELALIQIRLVDPGDLHNLDEHKQKADSLVAQINDSRERSLTNQSINEMVDFLKQTSGMFEGSRVGWDENNPDWAMAEEFYRRQAAALGINLSLADKPGADDMDSKIARIIAIGIKDLNPTRVLKNCIHLYSYPSGGIGVPAMILKLDTARMKTLGCLVHPEHGEIASLSLDDVYEIFEEKYCSKCKDSKLHDANWVFTGPWQKQQMEKLAGRKS